MAQQKTFQFHFPIFLISFSIAFLYVYIVGPERKAIIKYPTPFNSKNVLYHNSKSNTDCYMYESTKVDCPSDPTKITTQPVV
jgi:hypothetical protein